MKKYTINLEETIAEFYEDISLVAERPVEDILSDALFKQVEFIKRRIAESLDVTENIENNSDEY